MSLSASRASLSSRGRASPVALRDRAEQTAAVLPPLLVAAERVAVTVAQGVHGRRRVGQGETFWQFRQYQPGDAAARIDWRESAKSQRLYVRETEWEAAQSVWLWRDASASMEYSSADYLAGAEWPTKRDRAELLLVALASLLVRGGERLSLLGSGIAPMNGRVALTRITELISRDPSQSDSLPAFEPLPRAGQLVFEQQACINCHTVAGTVANGRYGPDLTHLMSRATLAAGAAANTPANLQAWITDPNTFKPGSLMPAMHLTERQNAQITAYLLTLK